MATVYWARPTLVPGSSVQGLDGQALVHLGGEFFAAARSRPAGRCGATQWVSFIPSVEAYREESRKKVVGISLITSALCCISANPTPC